MSGRIRLYDDDVLLGTFDPGAASCRLVLDRELPRNRRLRFYLLPGGRWAEQRWDFDNPHSAEVAFLRPWRDLADDLDREGIPLPRELSRLIAGAAPDLTAAGAGGFVATTSDTRGTNLPAGTEFTWRPRPAGDWFRPCDAPERPGWRSALERLQGEFADCARHFRPPRGVMVQALHVPGAWDEAAAVIEWETRGCDLRGGTTGFGRAMKDLFAPAGRPLFGEWAMPDAEGRPIVNSAGDPFGFRLGFRREHSLMMPRAHAVGDTRAAADGGAFRRIAEEAGGLLRGLPPGVAAELWRDWPDGAEDPGDLALWLEALHRLGASPGAAGPLRAERKAFHDANTRTRLTGDGPYPSVSGRSLDVLLPVRPIPALHGNPLAWSSRLDDLTRASVAACDILLSMKVEPTSFPPAPVRPRRGRPAPTDAAPVRRVRAEFAALADRVGELPGALVVGVAEHGVTAVPDMMTLTLTAFGYLEPTEDAAGHLRWPTADSVTCITGTLPGDPSASVGVYAVGGRETVGRFGRAAGEAGRLVGSPASGPPWWRPPGRLPAPTFASTTDHAAALEWLCGLFSLTWSGTPGLPAADRLLPVFPAGGPPPAFAPAVEPLPGVTTPRDIRAGHPGVAGWWFSPLPDLIAASVAACDVLLSMGAEDAEPVRPGMAAAPAARSDGCAYPTPAGTADEANRRAMEQAAADPGFARPPNLTVRKWGKRIGCGKTMASELPFFRQCKAAAGEPVGPGRERGRKPRAVSLTDAVEAGAGAPDAELDRLIREQAADDEPSPLDPGDRPAPRERKRL